MSWWRELCVGLRRPMLVIACAFLAFMLSVGALTMALGSYPPFMVVESRSMQHNDNRSAIGVIDTGDVVVVGAPQADGGTRTYLGSVKDGYRSFGEYGDVVVYQAPGEATPIVHRALCEVVYNATARGFDIPELAYLPASGWSSPDGNGSWWGLNDWVELSDIGYAKVTVHINLNVTLYEMGSDPHGGLITMGDNNWDDVEGERIGAADQGNLIKEPVRWEWVIGKVVGEVPWLGTIRLWLTGTTPPYMPLNSIFLLISSLTTVAVLPIALYASARAIENRKGR